MDLPPSAIAHLAQDWEIVERRWASQSKEDRRNARGENARLLLEELRHGRLPPARDFTTRETQDRLRPAELRNGSPRVLRGQLQVTAQRG